MVLVIPEALSLAALIFGFHAVVEWLADLGNKAVSALEHCAKLLVDIKTMQEWVRKVRATYRITAVIGEGLMDHLKAELHEGLEEILLACREVESLTDRITRSRFKTLNTWRALCNKSKITKMVEEMKQRKQDMNRLEFNMFFAQLLEEQRKSSRGSEPAWSGNDAKKPTNSSSGRKADPPPPYQPASNADKPTASKQIYHNHKRTGSRGSGRTSKKQEAQTSRFTTGAKTIAGAGIGGLTTLGAVTLLAPVTGVAAVAGATVYGLVAVGSMGAGAIAWARS